MRFLAKAEPTKEIYTDVSTKDDYIPDFSLFSMFIMKVDDTLKTSLQLKCDQDDPTLENMKS